MPILAGEIIYASDVRRLQPKRYWQPASGGLPASSAAALVPGCTITLTTETPGATVSIEWACSFYAGATAPATNGAARAFIDGTNGAPIFAVADLRVANDKVTASMAWDTTIANAGVHTFDLLATTPANMTVSIYSYLAVTVTEVVA